LFAWKHLSEHERQERAKADSTQLETDGLLQCEEEFSKQPDLHTRENPDNMNQKQID
jgi:hypothetical protein